MTEPERTILATALKALKQSVARRLIAGREHFWPPRYYDFNVWSSAKRTEKLKKENATVRKAVAFMVAGGGFEPPTFGL